ncbi:MAG: Thiamine biosynthesis lipoprotein ApbE precursor [Planctomycetes bacterium ADurb.Bin126]|nr:MAG: Thiamine biosynthesis lipoprotein ApbE precursor [Planctomycetes bacterium ADurb.Bin126]HOD84006.1 TIGR03663 family protein [Phycisphaerae bacterium]HQL75737.1 TIGR03663 family protein [Phycisphaerae bacterium]
MRRLFFVLAMLLICAGALLMRLPCLLGLLPAPIQAPALRALGAKDNQVPENWRIDARPMHTDEAVHAAKFGELLEKGEYAYDPYEYHGPTLDYFTLIPAWIRGQQTLAQTDELTLRIVPVAFGLGLVALLALVGDGLGRWAAVVAAVLTAVSHAFVYYSRYYIMEMLLVFFTFLAIVAAWRYARSRRAAWAVALGSALGFMFATKETWVISAGAMAGAWAAVRLWRKVAPIEAARPEAATSEPELGDEGAFGLRKANATDELEAAFERQGDTKGRAWRHAALAGVAFVIVWAAFFSSFGSHFGGLLDSFRTYQVYFSRAGGGESFHVHPWHYYFGMLLYWREPSNFPWVWSEALIVGLAAAGFVAAVLGRGIGQADPWFLRFLALYTAAVALAYTVIPYKTPWCLMVFLQPMVLLAGVGTAAIFRMFRPSDRRGGLEMLPVWLLLLALLGLGVYHLASQAARGAYRFYDDIRNPYVYAHSVRDVKKLGQRVRELVELHQDGKHMPIKILDTTPWPLPWYLRGLENIRYSSAANPPPTLEQAAVIIVPADNMFTPDGQPTPLHQRLEKKYHMDYFGLRPNVMLNVYIDKDLWSAYLRQVARRFGATLPAEAPQPATLPAGEAATRPQPAATTQRSVIIGSANWKPGAEVHRFRHAAMATDFEIILLGGTDEAARRVAQTAFDEIDYVERELSRFVPGSDIWRINNAEPGKAVTVSLVTMDALKLARRIHQDSGGVFDVTVGALLSVWRNPDRTPRTPSPQELVQARERTGMRLLAIDEDRQSVTVLKAGVQVDLGGIGKGLALDRLAALLREREVQAALVHGGRSSVLALGSPPEKDGWNLAFREIPDSKLELPPLLLKDRAVSGSAQGPKPHIMDPRTGQFVTGRLGAWAAAPTAAESDALSTAFMMMTPEQIEAYCKKRPEVSAMIALREKRKDRLVAFGKW